MTVRARVSLIGVAALLLVVAGSGSASAQSPYVDYYAPQFYMDYLVFFDEAGSPIYYDDNVAYAVPDDYRQYNDLVNHFQDNQDAYFRWFDEVGYANLHHRRTLVQDYYKPRYYHGYPVFFRGGQPVVYIDGVAQVIAPADPRYARLIAHYQQSQEAYRRWYRAVGRYYRSYIRPVYTQYYNPLYYLGYLIFYDASGMPFYYLGGRTEYVPRNHRDFHSYVSHYQSHRPHYDRWYRERGKNHHQYRQPKFHRERRIAPKAPRAAQGRAETRYSPEVRHRLRPVDQRRPHRPEPKLRPAPPARRDKQKKDKDDDKRDKHRRDRK